MMLSITNPQHKNSLHCAKCYNVQLPILFIVVLSVIVLNVVMLSVMLNVVKLRVMAP
jgi:hypothetical protein